MRLQQYINEGSMDDFMLKIKKDCQPFLKDWLPIAMKKSYDFFVYRGIDKGDVGLADKKTVRMDRYAMSTSPQIHDILDEKFLKKVGWRARSQSVFCVGDAEVARTYGTLVAVFPIGPYKFCWSPGVEDLYVSLHGRKIFNSNSGYYQSSDEEETKKKLAERDRRIDNLVNSYKTTDLKGAIESNNEIMIYCNDYYTIREEGLKYFNLGLLK